MKRDMNDRVTRAYIRDTNDVFNTSYLMIHYENCDIPVAYREFVYNEERMDPKKVIGMTARQLSIYNAQFQLGYR